MADQLLLSAYEIARKKLIQDNEAMLESLGLGANTSKAGQPEATPRVPSPKKSTSKRSTRKRSTRRAAAPATVGVRRSRRISGQVVSNCVKCAVGYNGDRWRLDEHSLLLCTTSEN